MSQPEMLQAIMARAYSRGYRGFGGIWSHRRPQRLETVLDGDEWHEVIRSEAFCQSFWAPDLSAGVFSGPALPEHLPFAVVTERILDAWKRHHLALQETSDLLGYCVEHSDDPEDR